MIALGDKVHLRACKAGEPGTVIREDRGKLVVYWRDMDYWSKHRPEALERVQGEIKEDSSRTLETRARENPSPRPFINPGFCPQTPRSMN